MWRVWANGANTNWSQATSTDFGIYAPNIRFGLKWYGDPASNQDSIEHRIESKNSINLSNKYVTVSFIAKSSVAQTVSIELVKPNAEDNYTTTTTISSSNISVTTTATKFSVTFLLDDVKNGLSFVVRPSVKNQSMYIAQVQLEEGSVATPFEQRPYGLELSLCQRYLPSFVGFAGTGTVKTSTTAAITIPFKVEPRVPPTGMTVSGYATIENGGIWNEMTGSFSSARRTAANTLWTNGAASMTLGQGCMLNTGANTILFTGCEL